MGPSGDPGKLAVEPVSSNASQVSRVSSSVLWIGSESRTISSRYIFYRFPPRRAYNGVTSSAWKSTTAVNKDPRPNKNESSESRRPGRWRMYKWIRTRTTPAANCSRMTTSCSEQVGVIFIIARDSLRNSIFESKLRHWSTTKLIGGTRVSPSWWNMSENCFRNPFKPFRSIFLVSFSPNRLCNEEI